ncbi:MAG: serine hydrolase [Bdellovibrionota bacterium]
MNQLKIFLSLFFFVSIQTKLYAIQKDKVDELAHQFLLENKIPGMSIAVINNNKTFFFNYGYANEAKKIKTSNETIYTIASFTKTFTAALSAVASVEGKLNLDEPFIQYFPELKNSKGLQTITSSELLAHVSSLPFKFDPSPKSYSELVKNLNQFIPNSAPGTSYQYSNVGIGIMGYVAQKIYSKNYEYLLEEKILKPLNMTSTYLNLPMEQEKYLSQGHEKNNQIVPFEKDIGILFAASSLKSTIVDMEKYLNAQINPSSVSNKNLSKAISIVHENKFCFENKVLCEQLAWQAHAISELKNSSGDSFFIDYDNHGNPIFEKKAVMANVDILSKNKIFIDKTGSGYGASSYMLYIPENKSGVVILLNKVVGDERIKLGRDILAAIL